MKNHEVPPSTETGEKIESKTLEKAEIEEIVSLISQYLILESQNCVINNWTEPSGIKRFEELNRLYNKLTGKEGEHFVVTNIREQIERNRSKER